MFIQQIKHIGSVGRFKNCFAQGDVTFKKYTLVFAENGRGKTTFCAILRSLQTGNSDFIIGRKTLGGGAKDPNIILVLADGQARFVNGKWNTMQSKVRIFDAQYITDNIYVGDGIGAEQRRNLCRLMLGVEGIAHRKAYDDADSAIDEKNAALRTLRQTFAAHVRQEELEQFLALERKEDVEAEIEIKRREVEGVRQIDSLRSRPLPETLVMPPLPENLPNILNQTLETVSRDADRRVREHLAAHGMEGNQEWIAHGMPHMRDDCPFCGQSVVGLELIEAYQAYFNHAYLAFRDELNRYSRLPGRYYADDAVRLLEQKLASNRAVIEVWARYVAMKVPNDDKLRNLSEVVFKFRDEMIRLLGAKSADPLIAVALPSSYLEAHEEVQQLEAAVKEYNSAVEAANGAIEKFKDAASPHRLQSAQNELRWLELTKTRHGEPIKSTAEKYASLTAEKETLEKAKEAAREKLDKYSGEVVRRHLASINNHLDNFNAGFTVTELEVGYSGREPNSGFCVVINATKVEMGTSKTPLDQPSFKNTLSGGDRTALALAFFLAQIEDDPDKAECCVVFDDPFNSQDRARRTYTINQITRCGEDVAQVVVLSHDNRFLAEMWDKPLPTEHRKSLSFTASGPEDTLVLEWNIEKDSEGDDAADKRALASFYRGDGGEPRDIVKRIRPVVERYMTRVSPDLAAHKNLGDKLAKVRADNGPAPLMQHYNRLDDLNTFTRKYMHGEGKNPDAEQLSADELRGWVKKTLELTGAM